MTLIALEREAAQRLPALLGELLDEPSGAVDPAGGADLAFHDSDGRTWIAEVKPSSRPGLIAELARRIATTWAGTDDDRDTIHVLVVPYMTPGGARAAAEAGLNWLDLSGNAWLKTDTLWVHVSGRPDAFRSRGRPSTPFSPRAARIARMLLLDPMRWWRQKDLASETGLDDGTVSRTIGRLRAEMLLDTRDHEVRPRDPALLLDAWADDYRFDRHDIVTCHVSGEGTRAAEALSERLRAIHATYAFTGLPAAWAIDRFASFRLITVYVEDDPREIADALQLRRESRGANLQLVDPNDLGVFDGARHVAGLPCVAPVQVYLDLLHLPERAGDAARHLRAEHLWASRETA